jgi:hypothetical protein
MEINVSKARLRPFLFVVMALVVVAGVLVEVLRPVYGLRARQGILPLLSLSYEENVPTFYSAALLLGCSLLLTVAAAAARKARAGYVIHWAILAAGFLYISLDEVVQIHEAAGAWLSLSGVLHYSWVVPAGALCVALLLAYIPFLRHLPRATRLRFLVAGVIYVGGAVGMELPLGYWAEHHGEQDLGYALIDAVEESLEMLGLNVFLLALLDHLAKTGVSLRFGPAGEAPPGP